MIVNSPVGVYGFYSEDLKNFIYIGKDSNIDYEKRKKAHLKPCNRKDNPKLHDYLISSDKWTYKVLLLCDKKYLDELEEYMIKKYNPIFNRINNFK